MKSAELTLIGQVEMLIQHVLQIACNYTHFFHVYINFSTHCINDCGLFCPELKQMFLALAAS